jgi:hypothetical protein
MSESAVVRVYVNSRGVDVAAGASALDAVRVSDADAGAAVAAGQRQIADSRGLPIDASELVYAGAIYRLISARPAVAE